MQQCSTHLSEQFIKSSVGKKGTPNPPPKKKQYGDISIKDEVRLLKWHKAILSRKSETKSNSFRHPAHKGNIWANSPAASCDWRDVFVSGDRSPRESFQLPEETLMEEFWVMEEPWCFHCLQLLGATPLHAGLMESLPLNHYRVQQSRVMTLGLQLQTSPKLIPPSRPLSEDILNLR